MGDMAWDPALTQRKPNRNADELINRDATSRRTEAFRIGGGLQNLEGGVPPREHEIELNNIEQKENKKMMARRLRGEFFKYPQILHKQGGLTKTVQDDEQFEAAIANGWYDDIRNVPELEPAEAPTQISHMTIAQALAFVDEHAANPVKLAEIEADETAHGNRAVVIKALEDAKDAVGTPRAAKKAKAAKK